MAIACVPESRSDLYIRLNTQRIELEAEIAYTQSKWLRVCRAELHTPALDTQRQIYVIDRDIRNLQETRSRLLAEITALGFVIGSGPTKP